MGDIAYVDKQNTGWRKLASVNIIVSDNMARLVETVEEVFELSIPLIFIIAAMARFRAT
ncbi:hypothetical protein Nwat_2652 [Nitrosococcus watsonii C-113]|uniref:Uncharacterized protein n=1 Tax=Nitrosococcus watsoni (strain C-113) TaxID=105559 RepID=D8KAK2_NITWC|nr:hypothetical protein Nwat_2652 [Nitrosococcus watsonii C-113]